MMADVCQGMPDSSGDTIRDGEVETVRDELAAMFITAQGRSEHTFECPTDDLLPSC